MKGIWLGIAIAAVIGPLVAYLMMSPGRGLSRWLWKRMPEGRLKRVLLKRVGDDPKTWPRLPDGP